MKKTYFAIVAMLCMGLFSLQAADWYPTNVVKVSPDPDGIPPSTTNGSLRDAVAATKAPAIYELERGGVYYVNGTCAFATDNVIVRAAAGTGNLPIVIPFTISGSSNDVFSSGANVRFENIYIYGQEYGTSAPTRRGIIRFTGGTMFEFENCVLDGSSSAAIMRFENLNSSLATPFKLHVNKTTFRNAVDYANISNARAIDFRDSKGIGVKITNSTFYSISAQIIRQGNTQTDSIIFNNNTVFGTGPAFGLGVAEKVVVKNNIFYNLVLNGSATPPGAQLTFDPFDFPRDITVKNNLFFRNPEFDALIPKSTTRFLVSNVFNSTGYDMMNATPAELVAADTLNYAVEFKNPPASLLPFYTYIWENNVNNTAIPANQQTFIRREAAGFPGDNLAAATAYSFSYPKTSPAATAGEGGTYLGAWAPYDATGVQKVSAEEVINYFFDSSAKSLNISFKSQTPVVKVSVFTATGVLISNSLIGTNGQKAEISLTNLNRGAYLFTVEMDGKAASGKFIF